MAQPLSLTADQINTLLTDIDTQITSINPQAVGGFTRMVAAKRGLITAGATLVLEAASTFGLSGVWDNRLIAVTNGVLAVLGVLSAGAWIHRGVTPAAPALRPTDSSGRVLVDGFTAKKIALTAVGQMVPPAAVLPPPIDPAALAAAVEAAPTPAVAPVPAEPAVAQGVPPAESGLG